MKTLLGAVCVLFGAVGWGGQLLSALDYTLAQRLGLQEKDEGTDPLFRLAERNTAIWDSLVLWTLIAAGVLLLLDHPAWPPTALVAGGIYLDTAGREVAKIRSLKRHGVRVGTPASQRIQRVFFAFMTVIAVALLGAGAMHLVAAGY